MPTVLVPLDETAFAGSILPDAKQIAGHGGRILLISVLPHAEGGTDPTAEIGDVERYLIFVVMVSPAGMALPGSLSSCALTSAAGVSGGEEVGVYPRYGLELAIL